MTDATAAMGAGIISADPTAAIIICWLLSAAMLGGLMVYAYATFKRLPPSTK